MQIQRVFKRDSIESYDTNSKLTGYREKRIVLVIASQESE